MTNQNRPAPSFSAESLNRRQFIATAATVSAGLALSPGALAQSDSSKNRSRRKRYALVGTGGRSGMFREAVLKTYAAHCQMVAFCDINPGRLKLAQV